MKLRKIYLEIMLPTQNKWPKNLMNILSNSINEWTNSFKPDDNNDISQSNSHVETKQPTDLFELPIITAEFVLKK